MVDFTFQRRGAGSNPGWETKNPYASWPKNQNINRSGIVTNSIKTFKMVHIKKKKSKFFLIKKS